ncbi:hypothetical protein BX600DRAFT_505570 [Xylariales sp. PMI_506]|nr:hypothetical protein BX600DRAFT_505570 [Xylariales sp. PMI_506]
MSLGVVAPQLSSAWVSVDFASNTVPPFHTGLAYSDGEVVNFGFLATATFQDQAYNATMLYTPKGQALRFTPCTESWYASNTESTTSLSSYYVNVTVPVSTTVTETISSTETPESIGGGQRRAIATSDTSSATTASQAVETALSLTTETIYITRVTYTGSVLCPVVNTDIATGFAGVAFASGTTINMLYVMSFGTPTVSDATTVTPTVVPTVSVTTTTITTPGSTIVSLTCPTTSTTDSSSSESSTISSSDTSSTTSSSSTTDISSGSTDISSGTTDIASSTTDISSSSTDVSSSSTDISSSSTASSPSSDDSTSSSTTTLPTVTSTISASTTTRIGCGALRRKREALETPGVLQNIKDMIIQARETPVVVTPTPITFDFNPDPSPVPISIPASVPGFAPPDVFIGEVHTVTASPSVVSSSSVSVVTVYVPADVITVGCDGVTEAPSSASITDSTASSTISSLPIESY